MAKLTKKEIMTIMYSHLATGSLLGDLAKGLFMNYPKTANAVLWVAVTSMPLESVHVTFVQTEYGFSFKYPDDDDFWYSLSEATNDELANLEDSLPELKDFMGA